MKLFSTIKRMFVEGLNPDECADQLWGKFGRHDAMPMVDSSGLTRTSKQYGIQTLEGCFGNEINLASTLGEDVLPTQGCYDALTEQPQRGLCPLNIEASKAGSLSSTQTTDVVA